MWLDVTYTKYKMPCVKWINLLDTLLKVQCIDIGFHKWLDGYLQQHVGH